MYGIRKQETERNKTENSLTNPECNEKYGSDGPAGRSYDVFGDGSLMMINIPGHSDGQCALKITNEEEKYVLSFADGGYAKKS